MDRNVNRLKTPCVRLVALRKESVDRNVSSLSMSCSAVKVALRKESVDRNSRNNGKIKKSNGRSPQGERG